MREIGDWFGLADATAASRTAWVVGCPFDGSSTGRAGSAGGPAAIREWSRSAEAIDEHGVPVRGIRVVDVGDVDLSPGIPPDRADMSRLDAVEAGDLVIGLGGDHSVTAPLVHATMGDDAGLLMLDAHPDCFDEYDDDRYSHACTVRRVWDECGLDPRHTVLVGLRSYATPELPAVEKAGLVVSAAEWAAAGSATVAARVGEVLEDRPVYVSLDIDVLDPSCAPGTGYPVGGGPDSRALLSLLEGLWERIDVRALDLVEVAPALDPSAVTPALAAHLLLQILAFAAGGRR